MQKFQKLQNLRLRKILGAFKISPTNAMEIEANIQPSNIWLNQKNQKLTLRIIKLNPKHLTRSKTSHSFPSKNLTNDQNDQIDYFDDWN